MAVKDSGEIATNSNYTLGDYSFRIERSSVPGSTNDKIEAICTDKDGKNARKSIHVTSGTKFDAWYVEANDTEASVYVLIEGDGDGHISELNTGTWIQPIRASQSVSFYAGSRPYAWRDYIDNGKIFSVLYGTNRTSIANIIASDTPTEFIDEYYNQDTSEVYLHREIALNETFTHDGKTVYYGGSYSSPLGGIEGMIDSSSLQPYTVDTPSNSAQAAWTVIYGTPTTKEPKEMLIARFPIEIEDAGGVGPGSNWTDPEDYDEDWEEGDPTHTLYVEVTGALSGRHNDPIEDPSYSYIPADKDTVKDYGCGGDGGHGGGGGAGASTVVVHKFATNQANSKEVTAIARRHGYGSGGGKGGKGGDGCILVYY